MSFAGGRRLLYFSVVALLIIPVLQILVCRDCKVQAVRLFPGNDTGKMKNDKVKGVKSKEELFHKFFNGRDLNFNKTQQGFEDSKRRVPSCPDPLHN